MEREESGMGEEEEPMWGRRIPLGSHAQARNKREFALDHMRGLGVRVNVLGILCGGLEFTRILLGSYARGLESV